MSSWWSGSANTLLSLDPRSIRDRLAFEAIRRFRVNEAAQLRAWDRTVAILRSALSRIVDPSSWHVVLEFGIVRLGVRADAVLVSPRGILVLEFKAGAHSFDNYARRQVRDYAVDLQDYHAGSRGYPIVPILVPTEATAQATALPLLLDGANTVLDVSPDVLSTLLDLLDARLPPAHVPIDIATWEHAPYHAVPGIIDAACRLFAHHDVADIASARSDATNLTLTTEAISRLLADARSTGRKIVIFVTGVPGAGKTLCGLATTFARDEQDRSQNTAFLTGNPTLVHLLREALVRDAVRGGLRRDAAEQRMQGFIQELPRFRDEYVGSGTVPPEKVIVVDEAQRSWNAVQAISKTRNRPVVLDRSEPAHLLDIMMRGVGFAAIVCLVGNGQEIHDGEGGLAEWGEALRTRGCWRVAASPATLTDIRSRSRLPALPTLEVEPSLHLSVPVRSLRHRATPEWVDAVLRDAPDEARHIASSGAELPSTSPAISRSCASACAHSRLMASVLASSRARVPNDCAPKVSESRSRTWTRTPSPAGFSTVGSATATFARPTRSKPSPPSSRSRVSNSTTSVSRGTPTLSGPPTAGSFAASSAAPGRLPVGPKGSTTRSIPIACS